MSNATNVQFNSTLEPSSPSVAPQEAHPRPAIALDGN